MLKKVDAPSASQKLLRPQNRLEPSVFYCFSKQKVYASEVTINIVGKETFFSSSKHMIRQ